MKMLFSLVILLTITGTTVVTAAPLYPLPSKTQQQQFQRLLGQFRCLVCQNQNLLDSNAKLAKDLRQEIYEKVQAQQSDQQIHDYLVDRYGEFVLFTPPVKSATWLLWFGPFLALLVALIALVSVIRRQSESGLAHD